MWKSPQQRDAVLSVLESPDRGHLVLLPPQGGKTMVVTIPIIIEKHEIFIGRFRTALAWRSPTLRLASASHTAI